MSLRVIFLLIFVGKTIANYFRDGVINWWAIIVVPIALFLFACWDVLVPEFSTKFPKASELILIISKSFFTLIGALLLVYVFNKEFFIATIQSLVD